MVLITDDELTILEALEQTATPGPWHCDPLNLGLIGDVSTADGVTVAQVQGRPSISMRSQALANVQRQRDAALIAALRTEFPRLLAEIRRFRAGTAGVVTTSGGAHGPR